MKETSGSRAELDALVRSNPHHTRQNVQDCVQDALTEQHGATSSRKKLSVEGLALDPYEVMRNTAQRDFKNKTVIF